MSHALSLSLSIFHPTHTESFVQIVGSDEIDGTRHSSTFPDSSLPEAESTNHNLEPMGEDAQPTNQGMDTVMLEAELTNQSADTMTPEAGLTNENADPIILVSEMTNQSADTMTQVAGLTNENADPVILASEMTNQSADTMIPEDQPQTNAEPRSSSLEIQGKL